MRESDIEKIINGECKDIVYIGDRFRNDAMYFHGEDKLYHMQRVTFVKDPERVNDDICITGIINNSDLSTMDISYKLKYIILNDDKYKEAIIGLDVKNLYDNNIYDIHNFMISDNYAVGDTCIAIIDGELVYGYISNMSARLILDEDKEKIIAERILSYEIDSIDFTYIYPRRREKGKLKTIKMRLDNHLNGYYDAKDKLVKIPLYKTDNAGKHLYEINNTEIDIGMYGLCKSDPPYSGKCIQKITHGDYGINNHTDHYTYHKESNVVIETNKSLQHLGMFHYMTVTQDSVKIKTPKYMIGDVIETDKNRYMISAIEKDFYKPIGDQYTYTIVKPIQNEHDEWGFEIICDIPEVEMEDIEKFSYQYHGKFYL